MPLDPAFLLVSSIIGLALGAICALLRARLPRDVDLVAVALFAIVPLALAERTLEEQASPRSLWEWTAVGGALVQAAYHIDPLALIAASAVALGSGVSLHTLARRGASPLLPAVVAVNGIVLLVLVSVTDLVAGTLVAGAAGVLAVVVGLFVASPSAAARLAALVALGVESFTAAALLLARLGVASFDLATLPASAAAPEVVAAMTLGAALFCGLYPFVPWRYEPDAAASRLGSLRGAALFATGIAGSVLALRLIAATDVPVSTLTLPEFPLSLIVATILIVLTLTALAVRAATPESRLRRAATGALFVLVVAAIPELRWSHVVGALSLLTVGYASLASAALADEWRVARFDVRLAMLWAAIASGSPLALGGALFGLFASAVALVLELPTARSARAEAMRMAARVLVVVGPFLALVGVAFADDPLVGALSGATLAWAGLIELGQVVREAETAMTAWRVRLFAALAAVATAFALAVLALPLAIAAGTILPHGVVPPVDLALGATAALAVSLAAVVAALPGVAARLHLGPRGVAALRRVLAATDPAPTLALAYHALEEWSRRIGGAFASIEDRAGVWLAALLLALTLIWAATS